MLLGGTGVFLVARLTSWAPAPSGPLPAAEALGTAQGEPAPFTPTSLASGIAQRGTAPRADSAHPRRSEPWSNEEYEAVLEELREVLPDNVYWDWAAPTRDADVLGRRQVRAHRMARVRAEIEANLADEEEIRGFYTEQWRDSTDYVVFFHELLARRGGEMTNRDVGLAQRAIEIHQTRLAWIPRRIDEAIARRAAYVERKSRWLAAGKPSGFGWDKDPSDRSESR